MKLYIVDGSNNCRKAQATHRHLKLDVEEVRLDFTKGDLRTEEYLALNPNARVPTLVDGETVIWESNAICQYLAAKAGDEAFYPSDLATRADIHRWQFWELAHYNRALGVIAFETILKPLFMKAEPDMAAVKENQGFFDKFAPVLEARLEGRPFIMGGTLTVADFSAGCFAGMAKALPVPLKDYPNITGWYDRLEAIPAWAETAPPDFTG